MGSTISKGQQITAKLFPNPVLQIGTQRRRDARQHPFKSRRNSDAQVQQLFELAGKRGYRIESAGFGIQSVGGRISKMPFGNSDLRSRMPTIGCWWRNGGWRWPKKIGIVLRGFWTSIRSVSKKAISPKSI